MPIIYLKRVFVFRTFRKNLSRYLFDIIFDMLIVYLGNQYLSCDHYKKNEVDSYLTDVY